MTRRNLWIVIPARIGSTRLQRKCLLPLAGRPLIQFVASRAKNFVEELKIQFQKQFSEIHLCVATDSEEIKQVVSKGSVNCVMTPTECASGTDRIYAAMEVLKDQFNVHEDDLVLNIQGDEPFFSETDLRQLIEFTAAHPDIPMGTLAHWNTDLSAFEKSSNVKVVLSDKRSALYFSRLPIPWSAEKPEGFWHHMGVYIYRVRALRAFATKLQPSELEKSEKLEQLRALSAGWNIFVGVAQKPAFGIDTAEDLERAQPIAEKLVGAISV